jgi:hypothetical protein
LQPGVEQARGLGHPMGRHKSNRYCPLRHLRRRKTDRFLSPLRFALRMSRRTEIGSQRHSISDPPPCQ